MYLSKDDRRIIYSGEINEELAASFINNFLILDGIESPIDIICVSSYGGEVESGLAMLDYVRNSTNQINFYCSGMQGSAQSLIPLAADNIYFTSECTHFLFHRGSAEIELDLQSDRDVKSFKKTAEALRFQNDWDSKWLSENSCKPPTYWDERMQRDSEVYVFAEEAIELELITAIKAY